MSLLTGLALFGTLGTPELIIILIILVLIFGASKLPQLGGAMGKTIRNFKSEMREGMGEEPNPTSEPPATEGARFCAKCGTQALDTDATFCHKCGGKLP